MRSIAIVPVVIVRAITVVALASLALQTRADADPTCDHVRAIADANAALMSAPALFASAGSMPRSDFDEALEPRLIAGIDYSLTRILAGSATRARADAECRARAAATLVDAVPLARALDAQIASLSTAITEGESTLARLEAAAREQLATRPELVALRLDLDALRATLAAARRERAGLGVPPPSPIALTRVLADETAALAEIEAREARLRTLDGIDVSVRAAIDRGLYVEDTQAYVATLTVTFNMGLLFRGDAHDRAARARADLARDRAATLDAQSAVDADRIAQLATVIADLERERALAAKLSGDDARRFERTLWRELATRKADHAFLVARTTAAQELRR